MRRARIYECAAADPGLNRVFRPVFQIVPWHSQPGFAKLDISIVQHSAAARVRTARRTSAPPAPRPETRTRPRDGRSGAPARSSANRRTGDPTQGEPHAGGIPKRRACLAIAALIRQPEHQVQIQTRNARFANGLHRFCNRIRRMNPSKQAELDVVHALRAQTDSVDAVCSKRAASCGDMDSGSLPP